MKKLINTGKAPKAIGPYNQAIQSGDTLYTSGQIPINPETGEMVTGGIEEQAVQVMENLKNILAEAGMGFEDALKTTIFITNMDDFAKINEIYGKYFEGTIMPARSTVQVAKLPKGAMVEIEVVAQK